MEHYLRIQEKLRKQQAERKHDQRTEWAYPLAEQQKRSQPLPHHNRTLIGSIHFVETSPSVLREMPWILLREHKVHTTYRYMYVAYINVA